MVFRLSADVMHSVSSHCYNRWIFLDTLDTFLELQQAYSIVGTLEHCRMSSLPIFIL